MMSAMTTRLTHALTYDAPLADVSAMLGDRDFREQVCEALGVLRHEVTVDAQGVGKRVVIEQVQATAGLPSIATALVGHEIEIVQEERWTALDRADMSVTIPGKPGHMAGTVVLSEADGVTTESIDLTIKVSVPLVGGKLEGLVSGMLLKALKVENTAGRRYLS